MWERVFFFFFFLFLLWISLKEVDLLEEKENPTFPQNMSSFPKLNKAVKQYNKFLFFIILASIDMSDKC